MDNLPIIISAVTALLVLIVLIYLVTGSVHCKKSGSSGISLGARRSRMLREPMACAYSCPNGPTSYKNCKAQGKCEPCCEAVVSYCKSVGDNNPTPSSQCVQDFLDDNY